ncbi:aminotransferase class IV [Halalkalibaculum sp. DA384]|uniref:aminotransferase class IV n=1 Tax=Halalkalibaculum sp. DA384 TaxID=3373606 RepID=UPI003754E609
MSGRYCRQGEPVLAADSRAVRYGDGCFETFRSYRGRFFYLGEHLERLRNGLQYLRIRPPFEIERESVKKKVITLLQKNNLYDGEAVVRIQVWREGKRGFQVSTSAKAGYCITADPLPAISSPVSLATVSVRRIPSEAIDPRYKLSNSINYIQAATEATERGADDALMQTTDGYISETTIANIFWMRGKTVYTPSEQCDILPGITRGRILHLLKTELNAPVSEGAFSLEQLKKADAAWICNSVRELVPVASVDGHTFPGAHPFVKELKKKIKSYRQKLLV